MTKITTILSGLALTGLTACNIADVEPTPEPEPAVPAGNEDFLSEDEAAEIPTSAQSAVGI
ncbi:MAG: hypothetical protein AAF264_14155 [Pseudomonadota bacterium]